MKIKKFTGKIIRVTDLSKTAKEVELALSEPLDFLAGSFVNVFMNINGEKVRRAYSISSSQHDREHITLTVRLSPDGVMTPLFWKKDMVGEVVELMGPLGLNTVDKMRSDKTFLFAFGVGAGVVKSIADYFTGNTTRNKQLTIFTGSRSEDEILYRDYFDNLAHKFPQVSVTHIISPNYIQNHISDLDFHNSDVYVCGQEVACNDLVAKVKTLNPSECRFFIEGFH